MPQEIGLYIAMYMDRRFLFKLRAEIVCAIRHHTTLLTFSKCIRCVVMIARQEHYSIDFSGSSYATIHLASSPRITPQIV